VPDSIKTHLSRARLPARLAYLGILLLATLSRLALDLDLTHVGDRLTQFFHPEIGGRDAVDGLRNLALFAGWGAVWMITTGPGRVAAALVQATLTGAAISLVVETAQLFSPVRNASPLDLLTNTVGTFAGALGLVLLVRLASTRRGAKSFVGIPALTIAGAYGIACTLEAWVPLFRQTELPHEVGLAGRWHASLTYFTWQSALDWPIEDLLLFLPAGALAVAAFSEAGSSYGSARTRTIAWGFLLSILAELGHGLLGQEIVVGAVLVHALSIAIGAIVAERMLPTLTQMFRGAARPRLLLRAYVIVIALWALRPYIPELRPISEQLTTTWWIPLESLGMRVDVFSVVDVTGPFFLYFPLGALLAVWPLRNHGWLAGLWPAVWLALATETAQLVVQERLVDITDPLVQIAGALIGWTVMRRAGYAPYGTAGGQAGSTRRPIRHPEGA